MKTLQDYVLHLADTHLILGQRLGELCGHGFVLEQDIAMEYRLHVFIGVLQLRGGAGRDRNVRRSARQVDHSRAVDHPVADPGPDLDPDLAQHAASRPGFCGADP